VPGLTLVGNSLGSRFQPLWKATFFAILVLVSIGAFVPLFFAYSTCCSFHLTIKILLESRPIEILSRALGLVVVALVVIQCNINGRLFRRC
jgi:hypothetical protein